MNKKRTGFKALLLSAKVAFVIMMFSLAQISSTTYAWYADTAISNQNSYGSGYWLPVLSYELTPNFDEVPDGIFPESPCLTFTDSFGDSPIYVEFSNDGNPMDDGALYAGGCVSLPDSGMVFVEAQAHNKENTAWKSNVIQLILEIATEDEGEDDEDETEGMDTDKTPPILSDITTFGPVPTKGDINNLQFTISWKTNELAGSNILYDYTSHTLLAYPFKEPLSLDTIADSTEHSITLSGLDPTKDTLYARVISLDASGNVGFSDEIIVDIPSPTTAPTGDIVLNEILPKTKGSDGAVMPDGEWVELYNNSESDVDLAGWSVEDVAGNSDTITTTNSDANGNPTDSGETIIPSHGYLVLYMSGSTFNNSSSEEVILKDPSGAKKDSHTFNASSFPKGKTIARFPDGVGPWIDPEGTPGKENRLSNKERDALRDEALSICFDGITRDKKADDPICSGVFLEYIGLLKNADDSILALPELSDIPSPQTDDVDSKSDTDSAQKDTQKEKETDDPEADVIVPTNEQVKEEETDVKETEDAETTGTDEDKNNNPEDTTENDTTKKSLDTNEETEGGEKNSEDTEDADSIKQNQSKDSDSDGNNKDVIDNSDTTDTADTITDVDKEDKEQADETEVVDEEKTKDKKEEVKKEMAVVKEKKKVEEKKEKTKSDSDNSNQKEQEESEQKKDSKDKKDKEPQSSDSKKEVKKKENGKTEQSDTESKSSPKTSKDVSDNDNK